MRNLVLICVAALLICSFKFKDEANPLIGRWESTTVYKDGPLTILVLFREDGTYDGFANKKSFVTGVYHLQKDTLMISDAICGSKYEGKYRLTRYGVQDSIQFHLIIDSCKARVSGINDVIYRRVKSAQK